MAFKKGSIICVLRDSNILKVKADQCCLVLGVVGEESVKSLIEGLVGLSVVRLRVESEGGGKVR